MGMRSLRKDIGHLVIQKIPYLPLILLSRVGSSGAGATLDAEVLEKVVGLDLSLNIVASSFCGFWRSAQSGTDWGLNLTKAEVASLCPKERIA